MLNVIQICEDLGFLKTLYFIKILIRIILIIVPVLIIIKVMSVLIKGLFSQNDEAINSILIKKSLVTIFIGLAVFFIPTIVNVIVNIVAKPDNIFSCMDNANEENIKFLTEIENKKFAEELENLRKRNNQINIAVSNSGNSSFANLKHIYVGDSKTVGMYIAVTGKNSNKMVNATHDNNYWYAKGSQRYSWFQSSAYPMAEKKLKSDNYIFYHLMGTNDLKSPGNAKKYVDLLEKLANNYPNSKFVVVSVTPVHDSKAKNKGYTVKNKEVIEFNKKYISAVQEKGLPNLVYCDVYSSVIDNFETNDGIHYSKTTYKRIYSLLDNC